MPTALCPVRYLARYFTGEAASSRSDEAVRVLDPPRRIPYLRLFCVILSEAKSLP